jgi:hypothetical protein
MAEDAALPVARSCGKAREFGFGVLAGKRPGIDE